ncbi:MULTISPECIES: hypothetical protein [Methanobacterium]|jgi:hypothetical protein|uniref:Aldolase n=1 Tax=Methanobacterium subterraneum TaxID=59277 RepID=A0A2H4VEA7_9EURY|nr:MULTISPECIES: hypothetical protein [Methanobacterium]AUB56426.1 hypothetical protein BK007_10640 [Methanobacterium subterraneum]AUB58709.1 hypothetical protein BK008_10560 [Methanobacterium sp. MZ-A1]MBW4257403.1 hypothetical protein [Methanobacterium sp. YSL]NMO09065.1 hypothetical protein [Methanobacterium subterraneum]
MSTYKVELVTPYIKDEMFNKLKSKVKFERKANIHGACVKLLTDNEDYKEEWEDNFKFMNEDIRPHAKIFSVEDDGQLQVLYEPISKTCIIKNCDYYGWIKSIALAAISDFFEEYHSEHRRYSTHGSAVDCGGHALAIIGPSGTGKTTLTYGLLQYDDFNYISDDWFFTRLFNNGAVIYSSEKNSYIRDDLAQVWEKFSEEVNRVKLDNKGRGIADVNTLFKGRVRETSTLKSVVLLERNNSNPPFRKLDPVEALNFMVENDFCNPHQLVRDQRKLHIRKTFFQNLFQTVDVYLLNTIETPLESLRRIKNLVI